MFKNLRSLDPIFHLMVLIGWGYMTIFGLAGILASFNLFISKIVLWKCFFLITPLMLAMLIM
jgi:hypothetical protein